VTGAAGHEVPDPWTGAGPAEGARPPRCGSRTAVRTWGTARRSWSPPQRDHGRHFPDVREDPASRGRLGAVRQGGAAGREARGGHRGRGHRHPRHRAAADQGRRHGAGVARGRRATGRAARQGPGRRRRQRERRPWSSAQRARGQDAGQRRGRARRWPDRHGLSGSVRPGLVPVGQRRPQGAPLQPLPPAGRHQGRQPPEQDRTGPVLQVLQGPAGRGLRSRAVIRRGRALGWRTRAARQ
jgi:hypothetical protein